jgi:hypothetical protein
MSSSKKKSKKNTITFQPELEEKRDTTESDQKYIKDVTRFFELKSKWETRKNKKQSQCVICHSQTSSMVFEVSHDLYLAKCGKKTCPSLEIARRTYMSRDEKVNTLREKLNTLQRRFILEKMNTMFKFIDNTHAIETFKKEFEEYRELIKVLDTYNSSKKEEERHHHIDELNTRIYQEFIEIQKQREHVPPPTRDIVDILHTTIIPLTHERHTYMYPCMEMNVTKQGELHLFQTTEKTQFVQNE